MSGEPTTHPRPSFDLRLAALSLLAIGAVTYGWHKLWFLVDDAYIAFRYVSNSMLGRGLVWNPAPFEPVEGYTSFLWVVLLRGVWTVTGIEPPVAANPIALGFGYVTLAFGAAMVLRMQLPAHAERLRLLLLALVLAWTISNRTFLTWLSSGLETSLFTFTVTYWLWAATRERGGAVSYVAHLATASALSALTRPDGLLFAAFAGVLCIVRLAFTTHGSSYGKLALAALPVLAIPAHLLFRYATYGYWLPNTYYAKFVSTWPESGLLYFGSFAIEYAIWLWLLIALAWLVKSAPALLRMREALWRELRSRELLARDRTPLLVAIACAALAAHFTYYTWVIGGDHFEYRVYAHLIMPLGIALAWMAVRLVQHPALSLGLIVLTIACAQPVPWLHFEVARKTKHPEVAKHFPRPLQPAMKRWDEWQRWLSDRAVCDRYHEHTRFMKKMQARYPSRTEGQAISWDDRPIIARECVGVAAWTLPNVAVIDLYGLNDRVIARTPVKRKKNEKRKMAHDRKPPEGYVDCFRTNVRARNGTVHVQERDKPMRDAEIRACDQLGRWLER